MPVSISTFAQRKFFCMTIAEAICFSIKDSDRNSIQKSRWLQLLTTFLCFRSKFSMMYPRILQELQAKFRSEKQMNSSNYELCFCSEFSQNFSRILREKNFEWSLVRKNRWLQLLHISKSYFYDLNSSRILLNM
jgi:hypothetical protein